jgi:ketosteroid isomerase-like protein
METLAVVEAMVAAVNSGRAERAANAMSLDGVFVDSLGRRIEGRQALTDGWRGYFRLFPDYRIEVDAILTEGLEALLRGRARGTLHRDGRAVEGGGWEIEAAWRAVSDGRRVALWQVYADNKPVYALLGT